jgi:hypothetical protein
VKFLAILAVILASVFAAAADPDNVVELGKDKGHRLRGGLPR